MKFRIILAISLLVISSPALSQENQENGQANVSQQTEGGVAGSQENTAAPPAENNGKCACMKKCIPPINLEDMFNFNKGNYADLIKFFDEISAHIFALSDENPPTPSALMPVTNACELIDNPNKVKICLKTLASEVKSLHNYTNTISNQFLDNVFNDVNSGLNKYADSISQCQDECRVADIDVCPIITSEFDDLAKIDISGIANKAAANAVKIDQKVNEIKNKWTEGASSQDGSGANQVNQAAPNPQEMPAEN